MYKTIIIILLLLILLSVCSGCTGIFKKNIKSEKKEKEFICTKIDCGDEDINRLIEEEKRKQNIIACIKVQPDCEQ